MRRPVFLAIFLTAVFLLFFYLTSSLSAPFENPNPVRAIVAIPFVGVLIAISVMLTRMKKNGGALRDLFLKMAQSVGYFSMGALSFLFPIVIARDLVWMAGLQLHAPQAELLQSEMATVVILVGTLLMLLVGFYIAASGPRVNEVQVPRENLPPELEGLRIAQISDLHVGPSVSRRYVSRVVRKVNQAKPDIVVLTGDIGDGDVEQFGEEAKALGDLAPKGRVFYVSGNHEFYWNGPRWFELFRQLGMQTLHNASAVVPFRRAQLAVSGVLDPAAAMLGRGEGPDVAQSLTGVERADFKILLAHQPGIAPKAEKHGVDLQISGHTHGGQFFPWTLVVGRVHEYSQGLYRRGRMSIYVSPGTGSWGPPIRLGTRPEISLLTLTRA